MTSWTTEPLIGFDLETTTADPETARIVQYAFVIDDPDPRWAMPFTMVSLVNPGIEIPPESTAVHGISNADVEEAVEHDLAVNIIGSALAGAHQAGIPIVGMNLSFDLTIIDRHLTALNAPITLADHLGPVLDLLVIDRHVDKYRKGKRNLAALARHYGVDEFDAHDASADARASVEAVRGLARTYPLIGAMTPDKLTARQAQWHRTWATDFDRYLRRKGQPGLDMPRAGDWPITDPPVIGQ